MHSVKFTIILFALLFLPFFLRVKGLEVYPAILSPEGYDVILRKDNAIKVNYLKIYVLNEQKKWVEMDDTYLLSPIPVVFFHSIFQKLYDSSYKKNTEYKFWKKLGLLRTSSKLRSADEWYINKLNKQQRYPYTLRVVNFCGTINLKTGQESDKITDEKIVRLHR